MRLARLCALAALCCAPAACRKNAPPHTVGLALDVGGRGDQSFNDGTLRGLETMAAGLRYTPRGYEPIPDAEYQKLLGPLALPHLGIPRPIVLQGKAQEDYEPNLRLLVDQGAELIVAVGFMMEAATRRVARDNPRASSCSSTARCSTIPVSRSPCPTCGLSCFASTKAASSPACWRAS